MDNGDRPPWQTQTINFITDASSPTDANGTAARPLPADASSASAAAAASASASAAAAAAASVHEKWRVPTVLAATMAVGLGGAMAVFLMWLAWRRVRKRRAAARGMHAATGAGHGIGAAGMARLQSP
jgi:hypothetical protein